MNDIPINQEDAIAFFRYQVIAEILDAKPGTVTETIKELSKKKFNDVVNKKMVSFSERTLYYYYSNYQKHGFDGLKPKRRTDKGKHPSLKMELIQDILALKKELPSRSAVKILAMLTIAKPKGEISISVRTINRILYQYGYTRESLAASSRVYVKHEKEKINEMWQSDVMSAFYIPDGSGGKKMAYLIGIIDDHSRRIVHSEFYLDSTLPRLEDTLRKAVVKLGVPSSLYVDNGKIFVAGQFKLICARLGIRLIHSRPYMPAGKGKIEKFWDYVQNSFLTEIKNQPVNSLSELNDLYFAWKKVEYDDKYHTSIESTPIERWNKSLSSGTKLKYFSPVELEEIFLHSQERKVNKYGVVPFEGNTYEAPAELIGKTVVVRYNPFHLDNLHIYFDEKYFGVARVIDLKTTRHKDLNSVPEESGYDSEISKLYFKNIKSNYQKYLKEQASLCIDKSISGINSNEGDTIEPHPINTPTEPVYAIDRDKFINIVKVAINIDELTFQEKGKLNELWDTFKEFNEDILVSILDDLSHKANDFRRNFLYYIAQIRTNYIEQLQKLKEGK